MGLSASKRVEKSLRDSPEFDRACDSVYQECIDLTQQAFPGVRPYQLTDASDHLHHILSTVHPLVTTWLPTPPTRTQVDHAIRAVTRQSTRADQLETLGPAEFKEFAVELFKNAVVSNAGKALLLRVPIGVAGIAGIGMATRSGKDLVGTAVGAYALGVATSIYLSLS